MSDNPIDYGSLPTSEQANRQYAYDLGFIAGANDTKTSLTELERAERIIELAIKYNLRSLKVGNVELTLPELSSHKSIQQAPEDLEGALLAEEMPSDEDMLHWSAPGALPSEVQAAEQAAHPGEE